MASKEREAVHDLVVYCWGPLKKLMDDFLEECEDFDIEVEHGHPTMATILTLFIEQQRIVMRQARLRKKQSPRREV